MALKKELKLLVSDSLGGEEWLDVLAIDFEADIADVADGYGDMITLDLNADNVHDIKVEE